MEPGKRVALVTGAGSGIGRAIAVGLAGSGVRVVVNYRRDAAGAEETVAAIRTAGGEGWVHAADVSDPEAVRRMFDRLAEREAGLDILVNNAGDLGEPKTLEELTPEIWDRAMANNLRSVFLCAQRAVALMKERGAGRIVNISSVAALRGGSPWTLPYAAAKGGMETLTRGLARLLGSSGITVNAVAPGSIATPMRQRFSQPAYLEREVQNTPVSRVGQAEEIAAAVLYLVSDGAQFVTGQVLRVDGGRSC